MVTALSDVTVKEPLPASAGTYEVARPPSTRGVTVAQVISEPQELLPAA